MPITYTLTGPTTGVKGVASTSFTLTPSGSVTDSVTLSDGGAGGVFSPASPLSFSGAGARTFTYTPPTSGTHTLTLTSAAGDVITGSPWTYTATPAYVWSKVQNNLGSNNSEPFQQASFGSPVTKGNLIVVAVTLGSSETPTISDTLGSSYTAGVFAGNMGIWYTVAASSGPLTVTVAVGSNTGITVAIGEYFYPPGAYALT